MPLYTTPIPEGRAKTGSTSNYSVAGANLSGLSATTNAINANQVNYYPLITQTAITLDQLACEVTTQAVANRLIRLGIYAADVNWQPTSLIVDAGTVAADSTGVKTATIAVTLAPGRYLLALISDGAPVMRGYRGIPPLGIAAALGTSVGPVQFFGSLTFSTLPTTGTLWTSQVTAAAQFIYCVFTRVSVP